MTFFIGKVKEDSPMYGKKFVFPWNSAKYEMVTW